MAFKIFRRISDMLDLDETSKTAGKVIAVNDTEDGYELVSPAAAAGGAPTDATYIVQTATTDLDAEQALGDLATGILKNTTTTGVLSIATEGTDYYKPSGTDVAVADGGTGASTAAGARANLDLEAGTDFPSLTTFNDHSARHENGGLDEISVAGLDGVPTELQNHLDDTADAHDASAISVLDTAANFTGTDVEAVLAELQDNIDNASGTGAPTDATYITQTANGSLSAEQALSSLATGIVKVTTGTGVLSTATANTDYAAATHASRHQNGGADEISIAGLDGTPTELTNHLNDATAAHAASAISVLDTAANFTGSDVEAVLAELQDNIDAGGGGGASGPDFANAFMLMGA